MLVLFQQLTFSQATVLLASIMRHGASACWEQALPWE